MLEFGSTNNNCDCNPESLPQLNNPNCDLPLVVTWNSIQGKPSCFVPCAHTHVPSDIIGLDAYIQNIQFLNNINSTNSIQLTAPSGVLNANLKLSSSAGTGYKVPLSILSDGLIGQIPYASGSSAGILTAANWNTFNNKFNTPTGTTSQYVRGDGSLANFPFNVYVPYTGATGNVNLGTHKITSDVYQISLTPTQAGGVGIFKWNDQDGTVDLGLKGGNVTLQIGQEEVICVVNKTGVNLLEANYQVVRIRTQAEGGAQGQRLAVKLAQANSKANHSGILGLVTETINNNQEGFITTFGYVRDINTTGSLQGEVWLDGDALWLSDSVAGRLTNIEPLTHPVQIGWVVYAHNNNGKIFVKVQEGVDELNELHDVAITTPLNNQVLTYETSTGLWKNKVAGGVPAFLAGSVPYGTGTGLTEDNAKFYWDSTFKSLVIGTNSYTNTGEQLYAYTIGDCKIKLQGTQSSRISLNSTLSTTRNVDLFVGTVGAYLQTSNNIPLILASNTSTITLDNTGVSSTSGGIATAITYVNTNSLTVNVAKTDNCVYINTDPIVGISSITPLTVIMPNAPYNGQEVTIVIMSATGLISLSSGELLIQGFGGTSNVIGHLPNTTGNLSYGTSGMKYKYFSTTAKWYRIY